MEFRNTTLPNGLQIVAECNPHAYSTSIGFFVRAGSRDEVADVAGVSHFLEHMVFKGTPRRTAEDVNLELDELGANSNAYTSEEQTVYYASVLPELLPPTLDLIADILRPSLRPEDFETEKKVIIEEIRKYDDQPPYNAHEKCMATFFAGHPLANSILGTEASITALSLEQMHAYHRSRYSPSNIVLAGAGRIDFEELERCVEQTCGAWEPYAVERVVSSPIGHIDVQTETRSQATQQYVVGISAAPAADDPRRFAARLLAMILGDETSSRIYWELVDRGLAEYAGCAVYEFQGVGILMTYLSCEPAAAERNREIMQQILESISKEPIREEELMLAKNKACAHLVLQAERPSSRLFAVGNAWVQRGRYMSVPESVQGYRDVTRDDILNVVEAFAPSRQAVYSVGPL